MTEKSLGICIGDSTISFVESQEKDNAISIISYELIIHGGESQINFVSADHSIKA